MDQFYDQFYFQFYPVLSSGASLHALHVVAVGSIYFALLRWHYEVFDPFRVSTKTTPFQNHMNNGDGQTVNRGLTPD